MERKVYNYPGDPSRAARRMARATIGQPPCRKVEVSRKDRKPKHKRKTEDQD